MVAPPDAVADCHERLTALGVTFQPAELPLRQKVNGIPTCGANDAVVFQRGPSGMAIKPPALVTCRLALALIDLDALAQELARQELGSAIKTLHQGGTYNCRKMARFDLGEAPPNERARFLRTLGEQAFDRAVVSVSLGPYWDSLHKDHFHFDVARYRVDGSRQR